MACHDHPLTLLALDAGIRETGWAVFHNGNLADSGVIKLLFRRKVDTDLRVSHLVQCLDHLVGRWQPSVVAYSQPSGIHWPTPAQERLEDALVDWSRHHLLCLCAYTDQEVRASIAGHPHASLDQLGYAVMVRLGLVGQSKTTHEWGAIAVGGHHLARKLPLSS